LRDIGKKLPEHKDDHSLLNAIRPVSI
jgi:hypothetical protein